MPDTFATIMPPSRWRLDGSGEYAETRGWTYIEGAWYVGVLDNLCQLDADAEWRELSYVTSGLPPPRDGYRWVLYTQSASAGLSGSMMMALRTTGLVEVVDPLPLASGTDWALQLPVTAEGIDELLEAAKAVDKLRQPPGTNWVGPSK